MTPALLLDAGGGVTVAIAPHEMTEVVTSGETVAVPLAPAHCHELLRWNQEWLPIFDLAVWRGAPVQAGERFLAVVAYQDRPGTPLRHGCLRLAQFPVIAKIADSQACALPDPAWRSFALSCFRGEAGAVPILSLANVFNPVREHNPAGS